MLNIAGRSFGEETTNGTFSTFDVRGLAGIQEDLCKYNF